MLKLVYGDAAVTMKTVYKWFEQFHNQKWFERFRNYKWFERFRNGCELVEYEERLGRPSTSKTQENVERVSEMIRSNRRLTIREISEDLNISYGSVQNVLTADMNMRQVSAKFVPRVLTVEKSNSVCQFHWSCAIVPLQIPAFQEMSSWEMKLRSMVTILRPGFRVLNGNHPVLLVRIKRVNQDPTSR